MKHRIQLMTVTAVVLTMWMGAAGAQAPYPAKPVRFIVGFPPGGTNDIVARVLAPKVSEYLGQQLVVENRGGANTAIASEMFVRTPPDGYTIMLNAPGHATNPSLLKLNFDSIRDFAFITLAAESQNLLVVHPSFPPRSVKELIAFSKWNNRVCPLPGPWNELWDLLPQPEGDMSPAPLVLAEWDMPARSKMIRLREQLEYAHRHGVLAAVDDFLHSLRESDWLHSQ